MDRDEKIRGAQEILNWAITNLSGNITCKVIDYKHENYRVQFFTKENKLIMPVQIPEGWIEDSNPFVGEDLICPVCFDQYFKGSLGKDRARKYDSETLKKIEG